MTMMAEVTSEEQISDGPFQGFRLADLATARGTAIQEYNYRVISGSGPTRSRSPCMNCGTVCSS